jgi:D-glycero-D-manno-heptose 1,7-bisphosphate phosphatase
VRPAVFLDRDGTLIKLVHHLTSPSDVRLIRGAAGAVARLRAAGYATVIVTNQSVIGRGMLTEDGLARVHEEMQARLAREEAAIDHLYFCPTAPVTKDPTVIEDPMRKPGPGMLLAAARDHALDLSASWMVGDTVSDMLAGRHAGCRTILVRTGYGARFDHPHDCVDHVAADLREAADIILKEDRP